MHRTQLYLSQILMAAAIVVPLVGAGCAVREYRYYDADHRDYHRWDDREDRAYRRYWDERHEQYRDWKQLNDQEQRDYWKWRHDHPDHK